MPNLKAYKVSQAPFVGKRLKRVSIRLERELSRKRERREAKERHSHAVANHQRGVASCLSGNSTGGDICFARESCGVADEATSGGGGPTRMLQAVRTLSSGVAAFKLSNELMADDTVKPGNPSCRSTVRRGSQKAAQLYNPSKFSQEASLQRTRMSLEGACAPRQTLNSAPPSLTEPARGGVSSTAGGHQEQTGPEQEGLEVRATRVESMAASAPGLVATPRDFALQLNTPLTTRQQELAEKIDADIDDVSPPLNR